MDLFKLQVRLLACLNVIHCPFPQILWAMQFATSQLLHDTSSFGEPECEASPLKTSRIMLLCVAELLAATPLFCAAKLKDSISPLLCLFRVNVT